MTSRERIRAALNFEKPDRIPMHDSLWDSTLSRFHEEGMPLDIPPEDYFGFDISFMFLDCSPEIEQKILEEDEEKYTFTDRSGYKAMVYRNSPTIHFKEHFTKDRQAWEDIKKGFTLDYPGDDLARIDDDAYIMHFKPYPTWKEAVGKYRRIYNTERYMLFTNYGPWEANWRHRGFAELLMDLALEPDFVKEMAGTRFELTLQVLEKCLSLRMKPDGYFMVEDLGENRAMLFSPDIWRRIYKPLYRRLADFLAKNNIDFWMHSCGNITAIIGDLVDCGLKVLQPLQVNAGLDVVELRREYGHKLVFFGNIQASKMGGPIKDLDDELKRKVPLWRDGGYIYHSDHSVPSDVSLERYKWILDKVKKYGSE